MARLSAGDVKRPSPDARKRIRQALSVLPDTTPAVAVAGEGEPRPSKYRNVRTTVDGITFASRREAQRYAELNLQLRRAARAFPIEESIDEGHLGGRRRRSVSASVCDGRWMSASR